MPENVRLVIWDLDETFWKGTVTEGGHTYDKAAHDTVIELARRGIMSSICSKNDMATVQAILEKEGIWDYFIFPSVNWEPKGARIKQLIEDVQLRPETVLFIDDNHLNLKEASHYVPGLQVAAETIVPTLLTDPLLTGKDDSKLSRLAQYKVMETRKADLARFETGASEGGSNTEFLRESGIKIRIEHDVEKHLDRVIELINRTNQLNFTKNRLPEDMEKARRQLEKRIARFDVQVGLIEVSDKYGDYGFCGYFQVRTRRDTVDLEHFCFSCRILNMGVEAWTYQRLGRPQLVPVGEVLSDPVNDPDVDWITLVTSSDAEDGPRSTEFAFGSVSARGGCNLWPLVHYFQAHSPTVVGEYNTVRDGKQVRLDHTVSLRQAIEGVSDEAAAAVAQLGYTKQDFQTKYLEHSGERPIWIFSNWVDMHSTVYRHKATGMMIPFRIPRPNQARGPAADAADVAYVQAEFEVVPYGEDEIRETLEMVLARIPANGLFFCLMPPDPGEGDEVARGRHRRQQFKRFFSEIAARYPNVRVINFDDFIHDRSEVQNDNNSHFDRKVYYRVFERIREIALMDEGDASAKLVHG